MANDKKGKGSGTKDACYHKVKARYSVWPSAYASGALVKCRKKGAANWGNKSESFEIDPKKHNAAKKDKKIRNMMKSPNENEANVAAKKAKGPKLMGEELNIDLAVDYFYTEGINEDGLDMIIEETGLEKFVEFVEYLTDIEVLTEARAAKRARKGGKSYEQVKAEIDAKEKAKTAKREISIDKTKKATATAKAKQPEKKPVRDAIARGVFRAVDAYKKGMERHNAAMATAKKAGKVAGKAAGEFAKGAGEGVKTAGKVAKVAYKVATKEEVEVEEGYKPIDKDKENKMYRRAGNLARTSLASKGKKKLDSASKSAKIVSAISSQKENERFAKMADVKARSNYNEEIVQSILEKCWAGYEKKGMKTMFGKRYPNCVKKEEVEVAEAMRPGERQRKVAAKRHDPYATSRDRATAHNVAVRNDGPGTPGYQKKSTGGKGKRYAGYGDQGAGNKARRRMGQEPLRGNTRKEVKESDSAFDFVKNELIKKHGAAAIVGTPENKAATAKRKEEAKKNKRKPAPDTRTDAQKMTDATGPRPGSRYRGD